MAKAPATILRYLHDLAAEQQRREWTDPELLERFVAARDSDAFAALVRRHGSLVLNVCRQVLGQAQDAEDAFQATFLVLARKAASVRKSRSLASWLHGVAHRVALQARRTAGRRREHEARAERTAPPEPSWEAAWREVQVVLDEEIRNLPERLRSAFLLCYVEGLGGTETARQLGCKERTVWARLAQARSRLQRRLTRRGIALSAVLATSALAARSGEAAVPASLLAAAGSLAASTENAPAAAAALAKGVLKTMIASKIKLVAALLLTAGIAIAGTGVLARQVLFPRSTETQQEVPPTPQAEGPARPEPRSERVEDLPRGALQRLGTLRLRHGDSVLSLAFSPTADLLASGGGPVIHLWDPATGDEVRRFTGHRDDVYALAFFPDGKHFVSASMDWTVRLWEVETGKEVQVFQGGTEGQLCVALSPDGKYVAAGGFGGMVHVWETATGKEVHQYHKHNDQRIAAIAFTPDGKRLVFAAHCQYLPEVANPPPIQDASSTIHVWDLAGWKELQRWETERRGESALAFAQGGAVLATGGEGVRLWDAASGKLVRTLLKADTEVLSLTSSQDGKTLAAVQADGKVVLWNADSGKWEVRREIKGARRTAAFARDGHTLALANTPAIVLCDARTGEKRTLAEGPREPVLRIAWSRDGKQLASGNIGANGNWQEGLYLWDVAAGKGVAVPRACAGDGHGGVSFLADGSVLAAVEEGALHRWNGATGTDLGAVRGVPEKVVQFAATSDGKTLVVADADFKLHVLDLATGKELRTLRYTVTPERGPPSASRVVLAISPDDRTLALTTSGGDPVQLWDLRDGRPLPPLPGPVDWQAQRLFSPDGRTLAGWYSSYYRLQELATGEERWRLEKDHSVDCAAWTADGRVLITGGRDGIVRLWDATTGKGFAQGWGHRGGINALAVSPDGTRLASGGWDTTIVIWDLQTLLKQQAPRQELRPDRLETCWQDLAGRDATRAYRAIGELADSPATALPFLGENVKPAADAQLPRLIKDLDSDNFAVRERAARQLMDQGQAAVPTLRRALADNPSPELRKRAEELLPKLEAMPLASEVLRTCRAVEVLERIGSPEARRLLEKLARGEPEARLTQQARASLERLAGRGTAER